MRSAGAKPRPQVKSTPPTSSVQVGYGGPPILLLDLDASARVSKPSSTIPVTSDVINTGHFHSAEEGLIPYTAQLSGRPCLKSSAILKINVDFPAPDGS